MKTNDLQVLYTSFCLLSVMLFTSCQTSSAPTETSSSETQQYKSLAPQRVDIRGTILTRHYDQGQVMLEVEGFPSTDSRYNRAYVLVLPTTQIVDTDGQSISLNEITQGQNVAILLRGGGRGNYVGLGVARKMWIEEMY